MALLWLDSFDHYATADIGEKYTVTGSPSISATSRRGSAMYLPGGYFVKTRSLSPVSTTVIVGGAFRFAGYPSPFNSEFIQIMSGATAQCNLALTTAGILFAARGGTGLGTATMAAFPLNTYVFIEFKVVIHPSAGSVVIRLDELEVLNISGVNTAATGTAAWDSVMLGGAWVNTLCDDLYTVDSSGLAPCNDLLGDCRVDARYPTAEGASSAWTPLSGSDNALMVDDPGPPLYTSGVGPDDDTTYNSTLTLAATDTHVVQDAPVPAAALYGVQLCISMKKSDAGTCSVAPVVRHSGTDYPGTAVNPGTAYAYVMTPYGLNPGTGAAWTEAGFNAAEFGYKRTA